MCSNPTLQHIIIRAVVVEQSDALELDTPSRRDSYQVVAIRAGKAAIQVALLKLMHRIIGLPKGQAIIEGRTGS